MSVSSLAPGPMSAQEVASRRRFHGLGIFALLLALVGSSGLALAADPASEDALRRRVKRFYVLSYLNRHGELWEMFAPGLRERLGSDRQSYVKSSRRSGFELYSSRIERVELLGRDQALVDVYLQVQLAGAFDTSARRHRMLWRFEGKRWHYEGSTDITHDGSAEVGELLPPTRVRSFEKTEELLPARVRHEAAPEDTQPPKDKAGAERWDLVAIPPPGQEKAAPAEPAESEKLKLQPPAQSGDVERGRVAEAPSSELSRKEQPKPELLPPERLAVEEPPTVEPSRSVLPADGEGSKLVRQATRGFGPRRIRAIDKLRKRGDASLAPLMAKALPSAPNSTAIVFMDLMAKSGLKVGLEPVLDRLDDPSVKVRRSALEAVGPLSDAETRDSVVTALLARLDIETFDSLRAAALRSLGILGGPAAEARLVEVFASAGNEGPQGLKAAAWAVSYHGVLDAEPGLVAALPTIKSEDAARALIDASGRLGGGPSLALLEELTSGAVRLPASAGDPADVVLWSLRAACRAGVPGAGEQLSTHVLRTGLGASSADVVLVAETGDLEALLVLLSHPGGGVRRRVYDLLGRVVESGGEARRALDAIEQVYTAEQDKVAFEACLIARQRLNDLLE